MAIGSASRMNVWAMASDERQAPHAREFRQISAQSFRTLTAAARSP